MASNGQRLDTATPHFKERTASVRRKQLLLQKMLLNPKAFLKQFMGRQKKAVKKKGYETCSRYRSCLVWQTARGQHTTTKVR